MQQSDPTPATLEQVAEKLDALLQRATDLFTRYGAAVGPQLYTTEQAADLLGIAEKSVQKLMQSGQLAWVNVSDKPTSQKPRRRLRESDIYAFIEKRTVQPPEPHASRRRRRSNI